jgi:hypothetical protein
MATTKSNGDALEGTLPVPANYPSPTTENINMQPMAKAYHLDGDYSGSTQAQKDSDV